MANKNLSRFWKRIIMLLLWVVGFAGTVLMVNALIRILPATTIFYSFLIGLGMMLVSGYAIAKISKW